jgi:hypothetical protein
LPNGKGRFGSPARDAELDTDCDSPLIRYSPQQSRGRGTPQRIRVGCGAGGRPTRASKASAGGSQSLSMPSGAGPAGDVMASAAHRRNQEGAKTRWGCSDRRGHARRRNQRRGCGGGHQKQLQSSCQRSDMPCLHVACIDAGGGHGDALFGVSEVSRSCQSKRRSLDARPPAEDEPPSGSAVASQIDGASPAASRTRAAGGPNLRRNAQISGGSRPDCDCA